MAEKRATVVIEIPERRPRTMPNTARKPPDLLAPHPLPPMTIEEFLEFTETRPDGEKWELIEGVAVFSPSPVDVHQMIVGNLVHRLLVHTERLDGKLDLSALAVTLPLNDIYRYTPLSA
jgi:Uma2 family endonuclease